MSFSRAKITRFNEAISSTPSPADYDVKLVQNAKGALIPKGDRFIDGKSPAHSDCAASVGSVQSTPCFRTPILPKKKKTIFTLSGRKPKPTDLFTKSKHKKDANCELDDDEELDLEALKDKIVECNNKDLFIKDLTEQIEEMKAQLCDLERQKEKLTLDRCKFEETCHELKEEHRIVVQNAYFEYDTETSHLKIQIHKLENELICEQERMKQMRDTDERIKADLSHDMKQTKSAYAEAKQMWQDTILEKEQLIQQLQAEIAQLEARVRGLEIKYEEQIRTLQKKHKDDMVDMEFAMLKSITETQHLLDKEKANFERQLTEHARDKCKIFEETTAKLKQIEEDTKEANVLAEIQMQERCKDIELTWRMTLEKQRAESAAILKECQAISEYSVSQSEWEKNEIKTELGHKVEHLVQMQRDNAALNITLQEMDTKCNDLLKDVDVAKQGKREQLEKHKHELQEMQQQKKLYEISITKAHDIIDTLKKRLLDSDHDVEQLKSELEACELTKLEFEARCNQLREELELVGRQNEALELEYHDTLKKADDRIAGLEIQLIDKIEAYKAAALQQVDRLEEQLHHKECDLEEVLQQLHCEHMGNKKAYALLQVAHNEVEAMSTHNEQLEADLKNVKEGFVTVQIQLEDTEQQVSGLQVENHALRQRLEEMRAVDESLTVCERRNAQVDGLLKQLQQMQEKSESYSQYCDYYKLKATEYESDIEELEGINKKYIEQSGKYDSLLQQYEALQQRCTHLEKKTAEQDALIGPFRTQLEAYDVERNALVSQKAAAEDEAKKMGFKYAQLLGHQNQKQKIKHMMDLKVKNYELMDEKNDLEAKLKSHAKTIEKLNKQLSAIQIHSPRKSKLHASDKENIASPNRTLNGSRVESPGPLRERN